MGSDTSDTSDIFCMQIQNYKELQNTVFKQSEMRVSKDGLEKGAGVFFLCNAIVDGFCYAVTLHPPLSAVMQSYQLHH